MRLGYHKNCGHPVHLFRKKYFKCSGCNVNIPTEDILIEKENKYYKIQKKCGIKKKIKKYDYTNWNQVKE